MAKQITRWFGKDRLGFYEVWAKKPTRYIGEFRAFESADGDSSPEEFLGYEPAGETENYFPALKGTKVGQIRRVKIIVD